MTFLGKHPPPVPARKSVRRPNPSPNHSRSPTPESDVKPRLPLVIPRTKSLRSNANHTFQSNAYTI